MRVLSVTDLLAAKHNTVHTLKATGWGFSYCKANVQYNTNHNDIYAYSSTDLQSLNYHDKLIGK